jgi:hypothetical protein
MNKLLRNLVFFSALLMATNVFASSPLGDVMKAMGERAKVIKAQLPDPSLNASSATLSGEIQKLALSCKDLLPPKVDKMPDGPDKEHAIEHYKKMIPELGVLLGSLQAAFQANDNAQAKLVFGQVTDFMKHGHLEFRENNGAVH